jgi:hypothetical protein
MAGSVNTFRGGAFELTTTLLGYGEFGRVFLGIHVAPTQVYNGILLAQGATVAVKITDLTAYRNVGRIQTEISLLKRCTISMVPFVLRLFHDESVTVTCLGVGRIFLGGVDAIPFVGSSNGQTVRRHHHRALY